MVADTLPWIATNAQTRMRASRMLRRTNPSHDAKRKLYASIVSRFTAFTAEDIFIVLHEPPLDNRGVRSGQPASRVDLGLHLKV